MKKNILVALALSTVLVETIFYLGCAPTQTVTKFSDEQLQARRDSALQSYSIGAGYYQQGDFESALKNFEQALVFDSFYYDPYIAIGNIWRKKRDAGQAEEYYRKAMRIDPKRAKAYEALGDMYLEMGRSDEALLVYQQGLGQDSSLADLYNGVADVYVRKGMMAEADSVYRIALKLFPDDLAVQRLWGEFLYKVGRYHEAVEALKPLAARFPQVTSLRAKLVDALVELKDYKGALVQIDTILTLEPTNYQAKLRQGVILGRQGQMREAIKRFDEVIANDSTYALAYLYKGEALSEQGNYSASDANLRRALALDPNLLQAYVDLGDNRRKQADAKRGNNLAQTSTANLKTAKTLYEEAKNFYQKALADSSLASYAQAQISYIDRNISAIDKELFVR
ncbi:MAG: tetratricopeptide repeat protein [bacterium]